MDNVGLISGYTDREDLEAFILSKKGGKKILSRGGFDPRTPSPRHAPDSPSLNFHTCKPFHILRNFSTFGPCTHVFYIPHSSENMTESLYDFTEYVGAYGANGC